MERNSPFIEARRYFSLSFAFSKLYDSTREGRGEQTTIMQIRSILFAYFLSLLFLLRSTVACVIIYFSCSRVYIEEEKKRDQFFSRLPPVALWYVRGPHSHHKTIQSILKTATKRNASDKIYSAREKKSYRFFSLRAFGRCLCLMQIDSPMHSIT